MSRAEERALAAYPSTRHYWNAEPDKNAEAREFYKQGYEQAEKDIAYKIELIKSQLNREMEARFRDGRESEAKLLRRHLNNIDRVMQMKLIPESERNKMPTCSNSKTHKLD